MRRLVVTTILTMLILTAAPASARQPAATPPASWDSGDVAGLVDIGDSTSIAAAPAAQR